MSSIILQGTITANGELEVELPPDLPPGPVEVEIRMTQVEGVTLGELLDSGLVGLWANRTDIEDSLEFARFLRRQASRREMTIAV
jgi:hypothetical protein